MPGMNKNKLVIIGAGGLGNEVAWLVERINKVEPRWELLGYVDDAEEKIGTDLDGLPVLGSRGWLNDQEKDIYAVCGVGSSKERKMIINSLRGRRFATLIDPSVIYSDEIRINEGSIICAGTILTVGINIGSHVYINLDCTVGHYAFIDDYVTLNPSVNISGDVILNSCVEMGTGSLVIQGISIGAETVVGAGGVVVKDLPEKCTAVGCPAKPIKYRESCL
jgi:sugar O-acyltransferase (sialic acid O-acetyltransferase NeuD family)